MTKKIRKEMRSFVIKRLAITFVVLFFFFVLFLFTYGIAMASYMVWFLVFVSMSILYVETKVELYSKKDNQRMDNIEYVIKNIKRK